MEGDDNTRRRLLDAHVLDYICGKRLPPSAHVFAQEAAASTPTLWYEGYLDTHWALESDLCFAQRLEAEQAWIINECGVLRPLPASEKAIRDLFIPVSDDGEVADEVQVDGFSFVTHRVSKLKDTIREEVSSAEYLYSGLFQIEPSADGLNVFWSACYQQRIRIPRPVKDNGLFLSRNLLQLQFHLSHTRTSNTTQGDAYSIDDKGKKHKLLSCSFSSNGEFLAFARITGEVSEARVVLIRHVKPSEPKEYFYTWPVSKSVDFCPTDRHLLCSCDSHGEIHIWNVERCLILWRLKGHAQEINSMCWDTDLKRLASVSNESAQVWALTDNEWTCHYKLSFDDYIYKCCVFHPLYQQLLVIGSYQTLGDQKSDMVVAGAQCLIRILMVFIVAVSEWLIVELSSYSGNEPGGMYSSSSYDGAWVAVVIWVVEALDPTIEIVFSKGVMHCDVYRLAIEHVTLEKALVTKGVEINWFVCFDMVGFVIVDLCGMRRNVST
uniref:Uncharacterized protein n=1 Tax=Tanacetum cinerariifolium TaxID=118510 RepID=A0A699GJ23_TANCI|nr:hypothetical protein [Tanacetum cinerariifolium]